MRRYWQRGKNKNALLPDYSNSGGRGKLKKAGDKKRGRPRKYAHLPEVGEGINISEADRRIFRIAINQFYDTSKRNSLKVAYNLMLKKYYAGDFYYTDDGIKKVKLISPRERPSFTQFKYWHQQEYDLRKSLHSRNGEKSFLLENRAVLGTSIEEVMGPGSRFQIDASVADIYVVSSFNQNWIIGRPVIQGNRTYFVAN